MNDLERTAYIDRYLTGQLAEAEGRAFEEHLQTDAAFREEVALQKALVRQIEWDGEETLRRQMRAWDTQAQADENPVRPLWASRSAWLAAASVSLTVLVGLWVWTVRTPDAPAVARQDAPPSLHLPVWRGGDPALGFASDSMVVDSLWVRVLTNPTYPRHYRFRGDTLELFLKENASPSVRLRFDAPQGTYQLTLDDSATYRLEPDYQRIRSLEP